MVLGLPRGGVPVAAEVADGLQAPLDVFLVRKLGVPGHEELAMGAIAPGGVRVLNDDVVRSLGIDQATIEAVAGREAADLDRRRRLAAAVEPLPPRQFPPLRRLDRVDDRRRDRQGRDHVPVEHA